MIRMLITGSHGQLGTAIRDAAQKYKQFDITGIDVNDLDLTKKADVRDFFRNRYFKYIINCAAYTAVDKAETEPDKAFAINTEIPDLLGQICVDHGAYLIHLSTDYVYSGKKSLPHTEDEDLMPISVYARSKSDGEKTILNNPNALILRTSWLYSEFGNNFLKTMIRLSDERKEIHVVFDQVGTPTYAGDLAETILHIILSSEENGFKSGAYNFSNEGVCSWYDFAVEIMNILGKNCIIKPIRTHEYPLPATRPEFGVLDKQKIKTTFGLSIRHWKEGLITAIKNLEK